MPITTMQLRLIAQLRNGWIKLDYLKMSAVEANQVITMLINK